MPSKIDRHIEALKRMKYENLCPLCGERLSKIGYEGKTYMTHLFLKPAGTPEWDACKYKEEVK